MADPVARPNGGGANGNGRGYPSWLRELAHFGGLIVMLTVFLLTMKSDQRSTREELARVAEDVAEARTELRAVRDRLPNGEALNQRLAGIDDKVAALRADLDFEAAKAQKFREDLLARGVLRD